MPSYARSRMVLAVIVTSACRAPSTSPTIDTIETPQKTTLHTPASAPVGPATNQSASAVGTTTPQAQARLARARVTITGVVALAPPPSVTSREPTLEICPGENLRPCAGVQLTGTFPAEFVSSKEKVVPVTVGGFYDGSSLVVDSTPVPAPTRLDRSLVKRCDNPRPIPKNVINASIALSTEAQRLEDAFPERHAATWWDRKNASFVLWFTGDAEEMRQAARLDARASYEHLCIIGEAKHSQKELEALADRVMTTSKNAGVPLTSVGSDTVRNVLRLETEAIDLRQRQLLRELASNVLLVDAYIDVLEGTVATLPAPPPLGDVALETNPWRRVGGMHALGQFTVRLDAERLCVYLERVDGARVLPIWPFGYAAYLNPFRIVDQDGNVVSKPDQPQDFGGGNIEVPAGVNACGAEHAWSGAPENKLPSEPPGVGTPSPLRANAAPRQ